MENNISFHFKVKVGEIEVEANGTEEYVKEIKEYADQLISHSLTRLKTLGAISQQKETSTQQSDDLPKQPLRKSVETSGKEESIAEFLEKVPNKTHQDKIVAFAYFLEKYRNLESFGIKEINDCYDEVKEVKTNTAVYINLLLKSGLLMKTKNQPPSGAAQYVLTRKAENSIKEKIDAIISS